MAEAKPIEELSPEELAEVERVETELDAFIEKRARQARDAATVEALWTKSEREHREKRRQAHAEEWYSYHDRLIRSHQDSLGSLVIYHQRERARYAKVLGLPEITNDVKEESS